MTTHVQPILAITDYKVTATPSLSIKSLKAYPGEIVSITGASGTGKTLYTQYLLQLINRQKQSGHILLNQQNLLNLNEQQLSQIRNTQLSLAQTNHLNFLNPVKSCLEHLSEAYKARHLSCQERLQNMFKWLRQFELKPETISKRYPHQLSGGERQRLLIIMAMINYPCCMVFDEPTTALDSRLKTKVLNIIKHTVKQHHICAIILSHELTLIEPYTDRAYFIEHGHLLPEPFYKAHKLDKPKSYLTATNGTHSNPCVKLQNIMPYPSPLSNEQTDIRQSHGIFNLDIHYGEHIGISGPSGCGKTQWAQAIIGLTHHHGHITCYNRLGNQVPPDQAKGFCQLVFQDYQSSFSPYMPLGESLIEMLNPQNSNLSLSHAEHQLSYYLDALSLCKNLLNQKPKHLSSGQLQKMAVIRAIITHPSLIIFDEITANLDKASIQKIFKLLRKEQKNSPFGAVFISHDSYILQHYCHRIVTFPMIDQQMHTMA